MVGSAVETMVWSSAAISRASISALYNDQLAARLRGLLVVTAWLATTRVPPFSRTGSRSRILTRGYPAVPAGNRRMNQYA